MDQHLTFGPHVKEVVSRCQGTLRVLARLVPLMTKDLLRLTYTALIRSVLEYCSSLLVSAASIHTKKLYIIEKKAARIILRQPRDAHAEPLLNELNLVPLSDRRSAHAIKIAKSIVNESCHPALHSMLSLLPDSTVEIPPTRTLLGRFSIAGAKLYNDSLSIENKTAVLTTTVFLQRHE